MSNLLEQYETIVASGEITQDSEQRKAAVALERLYNDLTKKKPLSLFIPKAVKGVYMYGGVGRGKSMLMDLFYNALPETFKKRRVHFHAFMIETHNWLHKARGDEAVDDLLPKYAKHVATNTRILCFDEFHVTDVADAMILSRLFTALFDHGVAIVATSNWQPDHLYEGGLQRDRFLPFIALVKERMEVIHLDSDTDYREEAVQDLETYLYPLNDQTKQKLDRIFVQLSGGAPVEHKTITVKGRNFQALSSGGVARFTFAQLCEQPHGAEDYLTIAGQFHTIIIENTPKMGYDRRNETKRLMTLIDVLYDARRRVIVSAEAAPERLYYGHDHQFEFDRTISRLKEMQSSSYLVNPV